LEIEELAYRALLKEVELTPKPGLVDKINNGSHKDMDIETFYASSRAIKPFVGRFFDYGKKALHVEPKLFFENLRCMGRECEKEMFSATKGVNTHKGAIFSFAVICSCMGRVFAKDGCLELSKLQDEIKDICRGLVKKDLAQSELFETSGAKLYKETKMAGIRDEAEGGYRTVFQRSLPFYRKMKNFHGEDKALKLTLLFIMSITTDSTLFARGGVYGMEFVKEKSKELLEKVDILNLDSELMEFDRVLIEKNLSAGGSADLLCLTWFLSEVDL